MNDSLSLTYTLTMDDVIAWHQYLQAHSAYLKRMYWMRLGFLCAVVFAAVLAGIGWNAAGFRFAALVTGVCFCAIYAQRKRGVAKQVRRAYAEGKNKGMIGQHRLVITDDGLTASNEVGEGKISWVGIEGIVEEPGYGYVRFDAMSAAVVPERGVLEGDYNAFMAELKRRWEAQKVTQ